jgi:hypothetical protein
LSKSGLKLVFKANIVIEAILRSIALINNQPVAGGNIGIRKFVDFLPIANVLNSWKILPEIHL